jgi:hypothetical protein
MRRLATTFLVAAGAALFAPAGAGATPISHTFDANNQGWVVVQNGAQTAVPFVATGGNPGGFVRYTDATAETGCFLMPPAAPCDFSFMGVAVPSLAANYGGTWSFDYKTSHAPSLDDNIFLTIEGGGGSWTKEIPPANSVAWQHYSGPLTEAGWEPCCGIPVDQAHFKTQLANAQAVIVDGDVYTGAGEQYSLDNFTLTDGPAVTPPPAGAPPAAAPPAAAPAKKKCKKGRKLKHGKCVKKKVRK